jgi:hypothetical protein
MAIWAARPRFRIRRFVNLNGDERLRISAGQPRPVIVSVDEAAALVRLLLDEPDVRDAVGADLETYLVDGR